MPLPVIPVACAQTGMNNNSVATFYADDSLVFEILFPVHEGVTEITININDLSNYFNNICSTASFYSFGMTTTLVIEQLDANMNKIKSDTYNVSPGSSINIKIEQGCKFLKIYNSNKIGIYTHIFTGNFYDINRPGCSIMYIPNKVKIITIVENNINYDIYVWLLLFGFDVSSFSIEYTSQGSGKTEMKYIGDYNAIFNNSNINYLESNPVIYYCNGCTNVKFIIKYMSGSGSVLCQDSYDPETQGEKYVTECTTKQLNGTKTVEIDLTVKDTSKPAYGELSFQIMCKKYV